MTRTTCLLATAVVLSAMTTGCAADATPSADAATRVTYSSQIQPILLAKCAPCHSTQHQGFHNIATSYTDAVKPVESIDSIGCWNDAEMTKPKKVGECALISAQNGRMPYGMGCDQRPAQAACVTASEQALMAQWVAAGLPE
ncbi:MAG TPA: hypothetical protein VHM31_10040 [Polyangia bacterium]|nr:hypothetical protein [Polyangia bacterium]HVY38269.1 hypothetical protein [Polyangia bacterium]